MHGVCLLSLSASFSSTALPDKRDFNIHKLSPPILEMYLLGRTLDEEENKANALNNYISTYPMAQIKPGNH